MRSQDDIWQFAKSARDLRFEFIDVDCRAADGSSFERSFTGAGVPPFLVALDPTPPNEKIYDFLMRKGVSPTMPLRRTTPKLQKANGASRRSVAPQAAETRHADGQSRE